jgi:hypothetical protein
LLIASPPLNLTIDRLGKRPILRIVRPGKKLRFSIAQASAPPLQRLDVRKSRYRECYAPPALRLTARRVSLLAIVCSLLYLVKIAVKFNTFARFGFVL